jgi:hypothetical protein
VRHIKIYLPCNFEVNPITHFGVISLFSSHFQNFNTFRPLLFRPSLVSIGSVVSEEKIFEKIYDVRWTDGRTDDGRTDADGRRTPRWEIFFLNHVTLPSNVPRGKEETEALPEIFHWQKNGLEVLPILFLVAKKTTAKVKAQATTLW